MKLVYWAGYLLCAGISCWLTGESLALLWQCHLVLAILVAIAFFIIASFGTKLIVDSFSRDANHPWLQLIGGTILVIIFWLICSMPTNTHTFFLSQQGEELVTQDISKTSDYLTKLKNYGGTEASEYEHYCKVLDKITSSFKTELKREICLKSNPGDGKKTEEILKKYEKEGFNISLASKVNRDDPEQAYEDYAKTIDDQADRLKLEKQKEYIGQRSGESINEMKKAAEKHLKALNTIKEEIKNHNINISNLDDLKRINNELNDSYSLIKNNADRAGLSNVDKPKYTAENIHTDTKRLTSVSEMVTDWWHGKYDGFGLGWWILFAILIDIAAFIFFYLATKKNNYF